jgi:hypothetical protein
VTSPIGRPRQRPEDDLQRETRRFVIDHEAGTVVELRDREHDCLATELLLWVTQRVAYYITLYVDPPELREAVTEHITLAWLRFVEGGGKAADFEIFFSDYCVAVEQPVKRSRARSYRQVWLDHALSVCGTRDKAHLDAR